MNRTLLHRTPPFQNAARTQGEFDGYIDLFLALGLEHQEVAIRLRPGRHANAQGAYLGRPVAEVEGAVEPAVDGPAESISPIRIAPVRRHRQVVGNLHLALEA